ncbi:MAG: hypothetical protein MUF82_04245 [Bacteroidetes bacterium]|jgi:hypothetical protein|nr:hypothetical protein [Bacteroidota bacterium]
MGRFVQKSAVFILCVFVFPACLETHVTTVVHPDGRLTRTLVFTADSATIVSRAFPIPVDSTWQISTVRKDSATHVLRAEQTFQDATAMNTTLVGIPGQTLTVVASLSHRPRWFFTDYSYKEIWKCYRHSDAVPLGDFLSPTDLDILYTKAILKADSTLPGDSVQIEAIGRRFHDWRRRNLFEAYFTELQRGAALLRSSRITVADVVRMRPALFEAFIENARLEDTEAAPGKQLSEEDVIRRVLGGRVADQIFQANANGFDSLNALIEYEGVGGGKVQQVSVTMPGELVSTNAEQIEGSTGTWKDALSMQYFRDVELRSESRVVHWWAALLTVALVAAFLIAGILRRRR